jgi:PAS domain S-box-containing protein
MAMAEEELASATPALRERATPRPRPADWVEAILEHAPCGILLTDARGRIVLANRAAARMFGWSLEELLERNVEDLLPERLRAFHREARMQKGPLPHARPLGSGRDFVGLRRDGTEFPLEIGLGAGDRAGGHTAVFLVDVTGVRSAEQRYQALFAHANDAICITDREGRILECNRYAVRAAGLPTAELVGRSYRALVRPESIAGFEEAFAVCLERGSSHVEGVRVRRADGSVLSFDVSCTRVAVGDESVVLLVGRDETARNEMREQILLSERMASVGMLAAGVAHEINNPLAAVVVNLELAAKELREAREAGEPLALDRIEEDVRDAREGAGRVREIVRDLKIFSKPEEDKRGAVDLVRVLDSTLRMAWNEIKHRARLVKDFAAAPLAWGNESRLGQVFLNLVVNAAQAIPEGSAQKNEIRVVLGTDDRGWAVVEIEDTGSGMPAEVREKLFTPFFTTKPAGVGTGLGLAMCHRIVSGLGGRISFRSSEGVGTTFLVAIPPAPAEPLGATVAPAAQGSCARARVLVVDDEDIVCRSVERVLRAHHDVTTTRRAEKALERIAAGEVFDVVLCDLMMPEMTGMELYDRTRRVAPALAQRFVFLTGGAFTPRARAFLDEVPSPRLEKPFDAQSLLTLVNGLLRGPPG